MLFPSNAYSAYICSMKQPGFLDQVKNYLFLKKKDPEAPTNTNIKLMHGMNRISILVFLIGLSILLVKLFVLKR